MSFRPANQAQRRYNRRILAASAVYAILLFGEQYALRSGEVGHSAAYALAALPALPIIGIFVIMGRYLVEEQDEYLRMRQVRQMLWATGLTMTATTLWGFMEDAGLPHLPMFYVAVCWFGALGVGGCIVKLLDR